MSAVAEVEPGIVTPPPTAGERPRVELWEAVILDLQPGESASVLGLTWADYERLLAVRDENRPGVRLVYDEGSLEIMAHGSRHERWKLIVAQLLLALGMGARVSPVGVGNVTLKRASRRKGLEPDDCYYVQRAAQVRSILDRDLDFETDPPPDLAIEVEITRRATGKLPVYAALGVPEVWRWDGKRLTVLHLTPAGEYTEAAASLAFPFLPPAVFASYLGRVGTVDEATLCLELFAWANAARTNPPPPETA